MAWCCASACRRAASAATVSSIWRRILPASSRMQRDLVASLNPPARSVWFLLRGNSQPPSNCPLSRRMLGVFLQRKRLEGVGNDFGPASLAPIDAGMPRCFSGPILLVELRTDADFDVVAAPKQCHESPSFDDFGASVSAVPCKQMWDIASA